MARVADHFCVTEDRCHGEGFWQSDRVATVAEVIYTWWELILWKVVVE